MNAARALFEGIVDYAGLFPPARLPMRHAIDDYFAHLTGDHGWMLQRFVCPASRVAELLSLERVPPRLSLILDGVVEGEWSTSKVAELDRAVAEVSDRSIVETVELRWPVGERLPATFGAVFPFLEVSMGDHARQVEELGAWKRGGAKLRTVGSTATDVPDSSVLASFIVRCLRTGVPFKATAGLHHPFRHEDAEGVLQHGFVNVFAAAVLGAVHALDEDVVAHIVADPDRRSFTLTDEMLFWREVGATVEQITEVRTRSALSFGSCSFSEPEEDLLAWGVL